jgi:hypothetical protein
VHYLVTAKIPVAAGNKMVKGDMQSLLNKVMGDVQPEQTFFSVQQGQRAIIFLVDVKDAGELPRIAEALWLSVEADVDLLPVVMADEFTKAGPTIAQVVSHY